jgi:hypothetical protein
MIVVTDLAGREVMGRQTLYQNVTTLEIGYLNAGTYFVQFIDQSGAHLNSMRFIKL